ncbi:hypothetical protein C467_10536 [Halorubrum hochstenium ATCC 700873]|uniref:Uncharacterized protein n=1 Tax=Halorubrum hochstenium ATCC 700873 TaxID=1227481 RepID=M0F7F1_9EURY|nr:hypothetical protein C467_10536 [Halorubrum hochstenium ATCC 700873]
MALTAGCASDDEPKVEISELTVVNRREENVEVTVIADRGGETVYEDTFEFDPKRGGSTDGVHLEEGWMSGEGNLEVTISADSIDEASLSTKSLAREREDDGCLSVFSTVDERGVSVYRADVDC